MNKKKECEECGREIRSSKLKKNRITEQLLCFRCNKRIGQNKFYIKNLPSSRFKKINNFSLTEDEDNVLKYLLWIEVHDETK